MLVIRKLKSYFSVNYHKQRILSILTTNISGVTSRNFSVTFSSNANNKLPLFRGQSRLECNVRKNLLCMSYSKHRALFVMSRNVQSEQNFSSTGALSKQPDLETKPNNDAKNDVILETVGGKGVITLNRERALNSLNLSMVRKIYPTLRDWESSQTMVIIKASGGKAFCAGGDVRAATESVKNGRDFFREEYQLNALIGTLHIPYVALIDGITMGGGVGLSVHGRYRVATENTLFAMPEMTIGLFPDVGGSYFLPRLGGKLGLFLALTGHRLKGGDVFKAGIATHMCQSHMVHALEQDLLSLTAVSSQSIEEVLQKYHKQSPLSFAPFGLENEMNKINKIFEANSIEDIIKNLKSDNTHWSAKIIENLNTVSPTSLKITLKLMELGSQLDLQECLKMEYRLAVRCCENHDFVEGVRALLVDKDRNPKWKPSTLDAITPQLVDSYFQPLPSDMELNL